MLAPDEDDVIRQLQKQNMMPVSIRQFEVQEQSSPVGGSVKMATILMFTKQLHTLLKAGIPIVAGLNTIRVQQTDPKFEKMIEFITRDIEQGSKLSAALSQFPKAFPPIFINSIKVGEVSGTLEEALSQLYISLDKDTNMKKAVKKAMRYPITVIIGIIAAFVVFMTIVVPNFIPLFANSGLELPLPTVILIKMHDILMNYGVLVFLGAVALVAGVYFYRKTPQGRFNLDMLILQMPIFGEFIKKVNISRFANLFYTMNRTGIPILRSFEIMQEAMENTVYSKEVGVVADKLTKGEEISTSLGQSKYFTPLLVEMVSIGEKSGSLDEMLNKVSQFYDQEVNDTVSNMTALIEPIVTVVLGGMIALLALALFMPMWDMMNVMK
jgi:type II secretory pathway component PulF